MRLLAFFLLWIGFLLFAESRGVVAAGVGALFAATTALLAVPPRGVRWRRLPDAAKAALRLAIGLAGETLRAGLLVAGWSLSRRPPLRPVVIRVPLDPAWTTVDRAFAAHSITLTPGELAVDDDGRALILHLLRAADPADVRRTVDARMRLWTRVAAPWRSR